MTQHAFWTAPWAEALQAAINRGPTPEERTRMRRPETYWQVVDTARERFCGSVILAVRDQPAGEPPYLALAFAQGRCVAARLGMAPDGPEPRYVLDGRLDDWQAVTRHGDLLRAIMYGTVRLDVGDPLLFFRDIAFFVEIVRCLAKVPTTTPTSAAA